LSVAPAAKSAAYPRWGWGSSAAAGAIGRRGRSTASQNARNRRRISDDSVQFPYRFRSSSEWHAACVGRQTSCNPGIDVGYSLVVSRSHRCGSSRSVGFLGLIVRSHFAPIGAAMFRMERRNHCRTEAYAHVCTLFSVDTSCPVDKLKKVENGCKIERFDDSSDFGCRRASRSAMSGGLEGGRMGLACPFGSSKSVAEAGLFPYPRVQTREIPPPGVLGSRFRRPRSLAAPGPDTPRFDRVEVRAPSRTGRIRPGGDAFRSGGSGTRDRRRHRLCKLTRGPAGECRVARLPHGKGCSKPQAIAG